MLARCYTVAFEGIEPRLIEVQCALAPGIPGFSIVGLPDKSVSESRERVRAALAAMALAMPAKRVTVNLSPGDMPKEGAHYDLPIAIALLAAMDAISRDAAESVLAMGELALDGRLVPVAGALPAALASASEDKALILPAPSAPEAAWVAAATVFGAESLGSALAHLAGTTPLAPARPPLSAAPAAVKSTDLASVRGQEGAKRALEIAAAGSHNILMLGPPGAGKSLLASCLPGILPPQTADEALESAMIQSVAGTRGAGPSPHRPFRSPHHGASMAAIIGGGRRAAPGEISLAHNGVLFLDELPEFQRPVLDSLRQPIETGEVWIARAEAHLRYPSRFMLVGAANPCRCGHMADASRACARAPRCGQDYMARLSGPLLDRFDIRIDVPAIPPSDLRGPLGEPSSEVARRVTAARKRQIQRLEPFGARSNADCPPDVLEEMTALDGDCAAFLQRAAAHFGISARGYSRILRVARTIADLDGAEQITRPHLSEAIALRGP
ncbi:YifB family Mg chelatase-like AAA ATPase [Ketogulonicigenium vulgare]|uniref:YifB family Mg chelatase-like AAA ATPase n=1 Tax=Ketogulonicigenium vulgare TaxID=92945 RepID=UPI0001E67796|nr:YifB family Mg chelatase-like AAA ATPase [Ketogulonicigenium vulgare]ADO41426.1 Mg chelatase-related protein [Ketogulonicigenium vulgare Y25]ALJ80042.1 AAA family ATPase [Ketogulonicigenium vulgare]ANW32924.1 AAA family ATPase [Ketogulonicigenium vulgare]AOZ53511.1 RNA polymerase sigma-32 factor [Ketogulonicigenium vulgare]